MTSRSLRIPEARLFILASLSATLMTSSAFYCLSPTRSCRTSPALTTPLSFSPGNGAPTLSYHAPSVYETTSLFMAKKENSGKRRRRRKDASTPSPTSPAPVSVTPTTVDDELPDFDVDDGGDYEAKDTLDKVGVEVAETAEKPPVSRPPAFRSSGTRAVTAIKRGSGLSPELAEELGGNVDGLDEDLILSTMGGGARSDSWKPPQSVLEITNDRSLEKFMDFDRMIKEDGGATKGRKELPTMEEVISRRKKRDPAAVDTEVMGKKATQTARRKAEAIERDESEVEEKSPFADLDLDLNPIELLKTGAWVGIGALFLWEVYINSPLFDRSAPLIPVVYDNIVPPGM